MRIAGQVREAVCVAAGQAAFLIGSLLAVRLLSNALAPSSFGRLALGLSIAQGFVIIFFGPKSNGIARYFSISSSDEVDFNFLRAIRIILFNASVKVAAIGSICALSISMLWEKDLAVLMLCATAFAISTGYLGALVSLLNAARKRVIVALYQGGEPWMKVASALILLHAFGEDSSLVLFGFAIACAILGMILSKIVSSYCAVGNETHGSESGWRYNVESYAKSFTKFAIFTWAYSASDKWAVNQFLTLDDVGIYSVAFMLGYSPMVALSNVLVQYATPIIYKLSNSSETQKSAEKAARAINALAGILIVISVFTFFLLEMFGESVLAIMAPREYLVASSIMPWLALSGGFFVAGEAKAIGFNASLDPLMQVKPKIVTALSGILLNAAGACLMGVEGVASASLMFSLIYFLWMSILARSMRKKA